MSENAKFTHRLFGASVRALNLTASRAAKIKNRAKKRPIKFYAEKIKIGSDKLAQKPDFEAKFYAPLFKKAAI